jgi:hypothetical protein
LNAPVFQSVHNRSPELCRFILADPHPQNFTYAVCSDAYWGIENGSHRHLDVTFGEDKARQRKDNSPLNMNVLRKTALSLLKHADMGRMGLRKKMFIAALNPLKLKEVIFGLFKCCCFDIFIL